MRRDRPAFTLVELLVVIATIGILVALILPAVQAARESARRAQCTSGAKNIALAILNFEVTRSRLPRGRSGCDADKECRERLGGRNPSGGLLHILPFVEEQPLYDRFEELTTYKTLPYPDDESFEFVNWIAEPGRETLMPARPGVYRCPSDSSPEAIEGEAGGLWSLASYALVSGSIGVTPASDFNPMKYTNDGLFSYSPGLEIRRITDGMTKTLLLGEKQGQYSDPDVDELLARGLPLNRDNFWQIGLGG